VDAVRLRNLSKETKYRSCWQPIETLLQRLGQEHRRTGCIYSSAREAYAGVWPPSHTAALALLSSPSHLTAALLCNAQQLWTGGTGNAAISVYDQSRSGAHYIAKLAGGQDFNFHMDNLDRLPYQGPKDLFKAASNNSYVPGHARGLIRCNTLALRDNVTKLPVVTLRGAIGSRRHPNLRVIAPQRSHTRLKHDPEGVRVSPNG
jgi:hypothetical protein